MQLHSKPIDFPLQSQILNGIIQLKHLMETQRTGDRDI